MKISGSPIKKSGLFIGSHPVPAKIVVDKLLFCGTVNAHSQ